jgi:hypothetical protein
MSPISTPTLADRLRSLLATPRRQIRAMFPSGVPRWAWLLFQSLAFALAAAGIFYAWRDFPQDVRVEPAFFALAAGLYIIAFCMHMLGWHSLTRIFFGKIPLRDNIEAIAGSNLVKYLPTIVWYIANRSHFYAARGVAQKQAVVASLSELALMVGSGAVLLVALWIGGTVSPTLAALVAMAGLAALIWALARHASSGGHPQIRRWCTALACYGGSWPMGVLMLWAIMRALAPVAPADVATMATIWLLAGLASYAVSLTLGAIGIAREITLTVLLAQHWPLAACLAAAIAVKLILTAGEVGCSLAILGWIQIARRRAGDDPPGGAV